MPSLPAFSEESAGELEVHTRMPVISSNSRCAGLCVSAPWERGLPALETASAWAGLLPFGGRLLIGGS